MLRTKLTLVVLVACLSLIGAGSAQAATKLIGTVGPGFTITLKQGTKKVTTLKPGTYTLVIKDLSGIHNFHLTGPGVNKATGIAFKGTKTFTIKVRKGSYKYVCDPHALAMTGAFKVG